MNQSPSGSREPDPFRAQLDERWSSYLRTREPAVDHGEWMSRAMGAYRDEIVHFGGQLLNDYAIREWDEERSRAAYARYVSAAEKYDRDPVAWEAGFWRRVQERGDEDRRRRAGQRPRPVSRTLHAWIHLHPTGEGGRTAPISLTEAYRPHLVVEGGDGTPLGVAMRSSEAWVLRPGETGEVILDLVYDGVDYSPLATGADFVIVEGPNTIGVGRIL